MELILGRRFKKAYRKLPLRLQEQVDERLVLFQSKPFDSLLNNHALGGTYNDFRSININGDLRALYRTIETDVVEFVYLDTHTKLYD